jgi:hypothetical protein
VTLAPVHDDAGIEAAVATHAREPGGGLISFPESFSGTHRNAIIAAASRHGLPEIGQLELARAAPQFCGMHIGFAAAAKAKDKWERKACPKGHC